MTLIPFIEEIIREAGAITLQSFNSPDLAIDTKSDDSPVTRADRETEEYLRLRISTAFPDDGIVGEEFGTTNPNAARRWILDPIDGTKTFIHGVPMYGTLIGVEDGDEIIAGAIYIPPLDELVIAERGAGCFHNGKRCRVSDVATLESATVLCTNDTRLRNKLGAETYESIVGKAQMYRTWGDCYGHLLIATGRAEIMLDPVMSVWDCAPMAVILEEAGGRFADFSGNRTIRGGSFFTSNAVLYETIRERLHGTA